MSGYAIAVPKLPKGLELDSKIRDAFAVAAQRHGVPAQIAQAIYNDVAGAAVADFEARQADTSRQADDATSILRDRFGADFDQKMASARQAFEQLGLNEDALAMMEISGGAANAIERLVQVGERLAGRQPAPSTQSTEPAMQQPQPNKSPRSIEAIDIEIGKLRGDADWVKRYSNAQHPRHHEAVGEFQKLTAEKASALRTSQGSPAPRARETVQADLDALQSDRDFQRIYRNPLSPHHRDYPKYRDAREKRARLLSELAAAERVRPAAVSRRAEIDRLKQDPEFTAALNNRVPEGHKDYQRHVDATSKWDKLNADNSAAEAAGSSPS